MSTPDEEKFVRTRLFSYQYDKPDDQIDWELEHIASVQGAVLHGSHETMFYPASGRDTLRVILAYDLSHLITVDPIDYSVKEHLDRLNIDYTTNETDHATTEFKFLLNNKERKITEVKMDARDFDITSVIESGKVDIFHLYLPTGAEDITKRDNEGNEIIIKEGFTEALNERNLEYVNVGGFICLGELSFDGKRGYNFVPGMLIDLFGIEKVEFTRRHPFDVLTSFHPPHEELPEIKSIPGVMYKKIKECGATDELNEVLTAGWWAYLELYELIESAKFDYGFHYECYSGRPEIDDEHQTDTEYDLSVLEDSVKKHDQAVLQQMKNTNLSAVLYDNITIALKNIQDALDNVPDYVMSGEEKTTYIMQTKELIKGWLHNRQAKYQQFLSEYQRVCNEVHENIISPDTAETELGFEAQRYYGTVNREYPFAVHLVAEKNLDFDLFMDYAQEFAEMDLDKLPLN